MQNVRSKIWGRRRRASFKNAGFALFSFFNFIAVTFVISALFLL